MKQLICEMCGSVDLIKLDGVFVCQTCGCKYSVEEARKMMIEGTVSIDGVVKTKNDDFEVRAGELIAYHSEETDVVIPDGIKIIGKACFANMQGIESITIPDGVYKIQSAAFQGCIGLRKIVLPQSLDEIDYHAFSGCTSLKFIQLPNSIQSLKFGCFSGCTSLESIKLPNGIQDISQDCFAGCKSLKSIQLPDSVQNLGPRCFSDCTSLESIKLPDGIQTLGVCCFCGCTSLESIYIPDSIQKIDKQAFTYTPALKTVKLPISYLNSLSINEFGMMASSSDEGVRGIHSPWFNAIYEQYCKKAREEYEARERQKNSGCYIATAVYGSYDCPQVWTLRRYRDDTLAETWYGRAFIRVYYAASPTLVKWFGHTEWFKKLWKGKLDHMVCRLNSKGVEDTPYQDRVW